MWWRSAYAFGASVPASGSSADVDVRLGATMWGYPAFWEDAGYQEFGQTFVASGPVTMIYLRDPLGTNWTRTITVASFDVHVQKGARRTHCATGLQTIMRIVGRAGVQG